MKTACFCFLMLIANKIFAQESKFTSTNDINGYIQVRGISNFDNYTSFSIRRLKVWVKSKPELSEHWSYKLQGTYIGFTRKFFLQDIKIGYKSGIFLLEMGQLLPQYSLQMLQSDYKIAPIERAKAVNVLVPNGTLGIRDIGIQANILTKNKLFESHLGFFNGYGVKEYLLKNSGFMITNKSAVNLSATGNELKLGYSVQYRKADNLQQLFIFPDSVYFSGNEFRYNIFARFNSKYFIFQAEYLNANFSGDIAYGYYFLTALKLNKNQFVLSTEDFKDLISSTDNKPFYRIGYNYYINDYKIKISIDNYFNIRDYTIDNYYFTVQLQYFLVQK